MNDIWRYQGTRFVQLGVFHRRRMQTLHAAKTADIRFHNMAWVEELCFYCAQYNILLARISKRYHVHA